MASELSRRLLLLSTVLVFTGSAYARGGRGGRGRGHWGGHGGGISGKGALWLIGIGGAIFAVVKLKARAEAKKEAERRAAANARLEAIERARPPKDQWEALSLCLLCGSPMVARTAKAGRNRGKQFMGCTSYPRCLGTRKIEKTSHPSKKPAQPS
ncbi:topoisomerase DNA-binding C4 zinc finger domain-containing protein [Pseudomonas putida]